MPNTPAVESRAGPERLRPLRTIVGSLALIAATASIASVASSCNSAYGDDRAGLMRALSYATGAHCGISQAGPLNRSGLNARCEPHTNGTLTVVAYPDRSGDPGPEQAVTQMATDALEIIRELSDENVNYTLRVTSATPAAILSLNANKQTAPDGTACIDIAGTKTPSMVATDTMPKINDSTIVVGLGGGNPCTVPIIENNQEVRLAPAGAAHVGSMNRLTDIFTDPAMLGNEVTRGVSSIVLAHELGHLLGLDHTSVIENLLVPPTSGSLDMNAMMRQLTTNPKALSYSEYSDQMNLMGLARIPETLPPDYVMKHGLRLTAAQRVFLNSDSDTHPKPYVQNITTAGERTLHVTKDPEHNNAPYGLLFNLRKPVRYTDPSGIVHTYRNLGMDYALTGYSKLRPAIQFYLTDSRKETGSLDTLLLGTDNIPVLSRLDISIDDATITLIPDTDIHTVAVRTTRAGIS